MPYVFLPSSPSFLFFLLSPPPVKKQMQRHATQLSGGPRGSASGGPRGPATLRRQNEFTSAQARVKERTEQQRMLRRIHGIRRYDEFLFAGIAGTRARSADTHLATKRGTAARSTCGQRARELANEHQALSRQKDCARCPFADQCRYRTKDGLRYFKQIKGGHFEVLPAVEGGSRKSRPP